MTVPSRADSCPGVRSIVVGTAGHVDHGKSALIRALTGTDPDRLAEEKRRGVTIDLGFAHLSLDNGTQIGFVDVPGHERFLRNMLAGVGGIDAVLLVIAANESIKPQTREHVEICRLLGLTTGIVALSKCDLVDDELRMLVELEVREFLAGTFLEHAPVLPVSTATDTGLAELRLALGRLASTVPTRENRSVVRLAIDRCFARRGFGTVITGTLTSGTIARDDELEILPAGLRTRARSIHVYDTPVNAAVGGQRTAINLPGVKVTDIERGMVVGSPTQLRSTEVLCARVELGQWCPKVLRRRTRVRFHHGTAETRGVLTLIDSKELRRDKSCYARMRLDQPVVAVIGDRFILRTLSPTLTLGGGRILDVQPGAERCALTTVRFLERIENGDLEAVVHALVERAGHAGLDETEIVRDTGATADRVSAVVRTLEQKGTLRVLSGDPLSAILTESFNQLCDSAQSCLTAMHEQEPLAPSVPIETLYAKAFGDCPRPTARLVLQELASRSQITVQGDFISLRGHQVELESGERAVKRQIEEQFLSVGLRAPTLTSVLAEGPLGADRTKRLIDLLTRENTLIRISPDLLVHSVAIDELKVRLCEHKKVAADISVAEFKTLFGLTRKHAIPLLEFLDRERFTRRVGEKRIIV